MIVDGEVYLKHYGKSGMKWGSRRAKNKTHTRSQKTVSAVASIGTGFIAARLVSKRTMDTKTIAISGVVAGGATKRFLDNSFDKHNAIKVSELSK